MPNTPWDASWHLRAELARLVELLGLYLQRQRGRGRSPAADAVHGAVIEDGEAEGLVAELAQRWTQPPARSPASPGRARSARADLTARADQGAAQGAFLPLRHAARSFELGPQEYGALLLALAVELDASFGRLVAYLNDHAGRPRPTVGLALAVAAPEAGAEAIGPVAFWDLPAVADGLLELDGESSLPGLSLRLPRDLLRRLTADSLEPPRLPGVTVQAPDRGLWQRLVVAEELRAPAAAWVESLRQDGRGRPLLLAGGPGSGRATAARALVGEAGLPLVVVDGEPNPERLRTARREARWYGAALLLRVAGGAPPSNVDWANLWGQLNDWRRPLLLAVAPDVVEPAAAAAPVEPAVLTLGDPGPELRVRLWQAFLPPGEPLAELDLAGLAGRFPFPPGRIARAVRRAVAGLALRPRGQRRLTIAALEHACREVGSASMGPLAQKLPLPYTRGELIVPASIQVELDLMLAWMRHQPRVLGEWGFRRRIHFGHGLTALFAGPSGTGKTMAAQVLARELGMDLYRVDLSRTMSKWIGETEKNLARLFDEARCSGAVLFFDEADALFGKRSEVKDAHDRYANLEIGYLLQRMEEHDGVTVLASNRMRDLDEAFVRRFHFLVDFPMPNEADRLRIWQGMFPAEAPREPGLEAELVRLAPPFEVSGGEIKNAVLAAAYWAAAEERPVGLSHLVRALRREMLKAGRLVDDREFAAFLER
jgi:AAA+ superfamily predicted ATPase